MLKIAWNILRGLVGLLAAHSSHLTVDLLRYLIALLTEMTRSNTVAYCGGSVLGGESSTTKLQ